MNWNWRLDKGNCTGCGICLDVCPEEAIYMPRKAAYPESVEGKCVGCQECVDECPFEALEVTQAV